MLQENLKPSEMTTVAKAICYIENHLDQLITLDDLASECAMSKYYFARTFKATTGQTFKTYQNHRRIEKAKKMLRSGKVRVTDACFEVGFNDLSYFNRVFRKFEGMSPSAYKKNTR